jgi:spore germination cell wall hydrolase CwlJ-like protein
MSLNIDLCDGSPDQKDFYDMFMMALCVWREARGEVVQAKQAVAWTIKNRASNPSWWGGPSVVSVILKPWQFSSFNSKDPNAVKFPSPTDTSWQASLEIAQQVVNGTIPDPTSGATSYFDKSLDSSPPTWATDGSMIHLADIGNLHFYKRV